MTNSHSLIPEITSNLHLQHITKDKSGTNEIGLHNTFGQEDTAHFYLPGETM